jgi:hypothetical protein
MYQISWIIFAWGTLAGFCWILLLEFRRQAEARGPRQRAHLHLNRIFRPSRPRAVPVTPYLTRQKA